MSLDMEKRNKIQKERLGYIKTEVKYSNNYFLNNYFISIGFLPNSDQIRRLA